MQKQTLRRYVQVTSEDRSGFVEFNFSIGDPDLFLEMILPTEAFHEFCDQNEVILLADDEGDAIHREQMKWRYGITEEIKTVENDKSL